ncbi:MAG: hypothetical protein U9P44_02180, partial [archaeon]|nr:hypothetical protein [archaeon]
MISGEERENRMSWLKTHNIDPDNYIGYLKQDYPSSVSTMEDAYRIIKDETDIDEAKMEHFPFILQLRKDRIKSHIKLLTEDLGLDRKVLNYAPIFALSEKYILDRCSLIIKDLNLNKKVLNFERIFGYSDEKILNRYSLITEDLNLNEKILNFGPVFGLSDEYILNRYKLITEDLGLDKKVLNFERIFGYSDEKIVERFRLITEDYGLDKSILNFGQLFSYSEKNIRDTLDYFKGTLHLDNSFIEKNGLFIGCSLNRVKGAYTAMVDELGFDLNYLDVNQLIFSSKREDILKNKELLDKVSESLDYLPSQNEEIMTMSDRILVLFQGQVMGVVDAEGAQIEKIG